MRSAQIEKYIHFTEVFVDVLVTEKNEMGTAYKKVRVSECRAFIWEAGFEEYIG